MADAATDDFFQSCQFSHCFPRNGLGENGTGIAKQDNLHATLSRREFDDNSLQNGEITDCLVGTRGFLHARFDEKTAILSKPLVEPPSSKAYRVDLSRELHLDLRRHRWNNFGRTKLYKRQHSMLLPHSMHRPASTDCKNAPDSPQQIEASASQRPFSAEEPVVPRGNLRTTEQTQASLTEESSPSLRREVMERRLTTRKKKHQVTATLGRDIIGLPPDYSEKAPRELQAHLQPAQPCIVNKDKVRAHVLRLKLQEQRRGRDIAEGVSSTRQNLDYVHAATTRSREPAERALCRKRRLHQISEKLPRGGVEHLRRGLLSPRPFADASTNSQNLHPRLNSSTATKLAAVAPSPAASSLSTQQRNSTTKLNATAFLSAEHPDSAAQQADLPLKKLQAKKPFVGLSPPPAAAEAKPLSFKGDHLLHARSPTEQTVNTEIIPGSATEHANAIYSAAAAIGCSGLLCVAGFALLLAIFRSYRLRQQKHEAAKQMIRKIHCSGELPTRELVVQYSHELRNQKLQYKDERRQTRGQSSWKTASDKRFTGRTPQPSTVALHSRHQQLGEKQKTMVDIKAAAPTGMIAYNGTRTEKDLTLLSKGLNPSHHSRRISAAQDRGRRSTTRFEKESEALKSGQTTGEMRSEGGVKNGKTFVEAPQQQGIAETEAPSASKAVNAQINDSSIFQQHGKHTPSAGILRQPTGAAAEKRNSTLVVVEGCRHSSYLSSTDSALDVSRGLQGGGTRNVRKDTHSELHAYVYKEEVPPLQPRGRNCDGPQRQPSRVQPEIDEEQRVGSKRGQRELSETVKCRVNKVGRMSAVNCSHAAPDGSDALFCRVFSTSHQLRRALFMMKKTQYKVRAAEGQLISPPSCQAAERAGQGAVLYSADTPHPSSAVSALVFTCPHLNEYNRNPDLKSRAAAYPPAELIHPCARASTGFWKGKNSCSSESTASTTTGNTNISDDKNRAEFFSCAQVPRCKAYEDYHRDVSNRESNDFLYQKQPIPKCSHEGHAGFTPADGGEKLTRMREVSNDISGCLQTKISVFSGGVFAGNASSAAENNSRGDAYPPSTAAASEWEDCTMTDIPTHMMTTAVNKEEEGSSEMATSSNVEDPEDEDDAIVEFDSANVSLELEEAILSRQSPNF